MHLLIDLQACQTTGSRHRGIGRYALSLSRAIAQQCVATHRVSLLLSDRFPETVHTLRSEFEPWIERANIHVMSVPGPCRELDNANFIRLRVAERMRQHLIAQIRPDCVHVSSLFEGLIDDAVCTVEPSPGVPWITAVTLFDLIPFLNADHYLADAPTRHWYFRRLQSLKNADLLLAISESSRQECIDCLGSDPEEVVNISSAIDPHFRPLPVSDAQRQDLANRYGIARQFVMYTGGIDFRKNIEGLIEAYSLMPDAVRKRMQLVVVCSIQAADRERLQRLAGQLGLAGDELMLTGYVPEPDLVALYNLAELFVFPSLHEGFGLPVLEAMACGTPAIGSNCSSLPEVLGLPEALFDPRDPQAIAVAMARALTDDGHRAHLRLHGLQQAGKFSWAKSARNALAAMQRAVLEKQSTPRAPGACWPAGRRRLRLAYVSPLPPLRSGIADYSANLLPELARHYDIELVTDQDVIEVPWLQANYPVRRTDWFSLHADRYDRILYHLGNSEFHAHMIPLLRARPGVVMLHDYFISGLLYHMQSRGLDDQPFSMGLLRSHGYGALRAACQPDPTEAIMAYPANRSVLDDALGVLVHSRYAMERATQEYGAHYAEKMVQLPFAVPRPVSRERGGESARQRARDALAIPQDLFLVCSFGFMGPTKLNLELLQAWHASGLGADGRARLVFVGQGPGGDYGQATEAMAQRCRNVSVTGFASPRAYADWLDAADVGVQLRTQTRGETSAAIFDCLAHQLPLIYNTHGTAAELPQALGVRLPDAVSSEALADALLSLRAQPQRRQEMGREGLDHVLAHHQPAQVAGRYRDAIEHFYLQGAPASELALIDEIAAINGSGLGPPADGVDLQKFGIGIVAHRRHVGSPRLVCDITDLQETQLRRLVVDFLEGSPAPWQIEWVTASGPGWSAARCRVVAALNLRMDLAEECIVARHDDIWLTFCNGSLAGRSSPVYAHRAVQMHMPESGLADTHIQAIWQWLQNGGEPPPFLNPWETSCEASASS